MEQNTATQPDAIAPIVAVPVSSPCSMALRPLIDQDQCKQNLQGGLYPQGFTVQPNNRLRALR